MHHPDLQLHCGWGAATSLRGQVNDPVTYIKGQNKDQLDAPERWRMITRLSDCQNRPKACMLKTSSKTFKFTCVLVQFDMMSNQVNPDPASSNSWVHCNKFWASAGKNSCWPDKFITSEACSILAEQKKSRSCINGCKPTSYMKDESAIKSKAIN